MKKIIIARPQIDNYVTDVAAEEICCDCERLYAAMANGGRIENVYPHCERCRWAALYETEVEENAND